MSDTDTRISMSAPDGTALLDRLRAAPRATTKPAALSPEALAVAATPAPAPISPIVLAGFVRMAEFVLVVLVGLAAFAVYLPQTETLFWHYAIAIFTIAMLSMFAFQTADIYQVQAFRGHEKQYMRLASAWSVVFLIVIGASFFAKAGEMFSRVWLGSFYVSGLMALMASRKLLFLLVRKWTREGRLTRRTVIVGGGVSGESVIKELQQQKDSGVKIIGLFDDRGDERSSMDCAGERKLGIVDDLVEFGRRTRVDLVIFSLPISAEDRILQMLKKLWVLPVDIRLAAHANKLRFRPRSYSYIGKVPVLDVFDRPIADWDVVMKWLFDKFIGGLLLAPRAAADGADRDRHQARQPRPGPVQAEALRLQQRPDRGLQVPLDVCRCSRRHRQQARHQGRSARHARRAHHPQDQPRRAAAAVQRGAQGQPVAGRPAPARGQRQGRSPALRRGRGRLLRPPPRQAGHHRLGADQRLARRDRHPRENPAARRARSLLHRELVGTVRSLHPGENAVRAAQDRECVLITAHDIAIRHAAPPLRAPAMPAPAAAFSERLLLMVLYVTVLASSVAFIEPSPHDVLMGVLPSPASSPACGLSVTSRCCCCCC